MAVHLPVEDEPLCIRTIESERGMPVSAVSFGKSQRLLLRIDARTVTNEGIIRALEINPSRIIEDNAPPSPVVIVELRRPPFSVHRQIFDIPDAVQRGLDTSTATL